MAALALAPAPPRPRLLVCTPDKRAGLHVPLLKTLYQTVSAYYTDGCFALQTCLGSMQSYKRRVIQADDAKKTREYLQATGTMIYSHAPYILNLAKEDNKAVIAALQEETDQMTKIGGRTVVHIGSGGKIDDVVATLKAVRFRRHSLLIENAAGEKNKLGSSLEEIREIVEAVDGLGVCLDTAHAYGAGLCRFDSKKEVDAFFKETEPFAESLLLLHLNDSKVPFAAHSDRHEDLEKGHIWGVGERGEDGKWPTSRDIQHPGLKYLIEATLSREIDIVLETKSPIEDSKKVKRLIYGRV